MTLEGTETMDKNRMRLPKESLVEPEERRKDSLIDSGDVEGHGLPLTAPPSFGTTSGPSHGGEIATPDEDDDVEGHRRR